MTSEFSVIQLTKSREELMKLLNSDQLHQSSYWVTNTLKKIGSKLKIFSERTGERLLISTYRFRYTVGTRAGRQGFDPMVIAEILDHTDNQNAHIYIENIPEFVEKIDRAMGSQLARHAQLFNGVLVDKEADAKRGNDLNSRIKSRGEGVCISLHCKLKLSP